MTTAIVLAGHGSHISSETAGLVWKQVDKLRTLGITEEITAAFWKEQPAYRTVFNTLCADDITVVPLFTAQGYFTQTVIPTEMTLNGHITQRDGRTIRYARTLSEHPYLSQVVRQRIFDTFQMLQSPPEKTAVAIIGHSTRRNPESRKAAEAQAAQIRALNLVSQVEAVYLDDSPEISEIYNLTSAPYLIAVPYFLAAGSHTTMDVPAELGLEPGQSFATINNRTVIYTAPVGVDDTLLSAILELAHETGAPLMPSNFQNSWQGFPSSGRNELIERVQKSDVMKFGQLRLSRNIVSHWEDTTPTIELNTPAELRAFIRESPFRSLPTTCDLPDGWHVPIENPEMIHAVVETIYPGAIADWATHNRKAFSINTFEETISRQTGNYRKLESLNDDTKRSLVHKVCGQCIRLPAWFFEEIPGGIPCPEPCNHWLSSAQKAIS